jgi:hypothetical protein
MKFEITCKGNTTLEDIDKELIVFEEEVEKEWETQIENTKQKLKGKLSMLPVPINLDFTQIILSHVKKDDKTMIMTTNVGGSGETKFGRLQKMIFKGANKKMVKNLTGFLNAKGLDVEVSISKD